MNRISKLPTVDSLCQSRSYSRTRISPLSLRCLHTTPAKPATIAPITASGPPPSAPIASAEQVDSRVARRRKQAELLKRGRDLRSIAAGSGGGTAKLKRFWNDVHVKHADEGLQVYLDKRPIRRPSKAILNVPHHKPHLASALALEWDLLISAQQALRHELIPLTSLVSRALDIADEDAAGGNEIRSSIVTTLMRYLDTDALLCWAPKPAAEPPGYETHENRTESLRSIQERTALPIVAYLTERVWPGIEIVPDSDASTIMPTPQPQMTKDVIRGWVSGLPPFELAGLERAALAGKTFLAAARLVVEWSTELAHLRDEAAGEKFGVEEAAKAASLEVDWQTGMWGEVEDTHDVNKEDVRRQLGSVVLLISGQQK